MAVKIKRGALCLLLAALALLSACNRVDPAPTEPPTQPPTTVAPTTEAPTEPPTEPPTQPPATEPQVLERFEDLLERNRDFVGWITVPGTIIDYPVVYCEDNLFYLTHDFDTYSDPDGTIFLAMEAGLLENNQSWALFGHHRKNGLMFSDLHKYKKLAFLQESPVFTFDTLYQEADYKIFSVFYMPGTPEDDYIYYYLPGGFESEADFEYHLDQIRARSIYDIPVEVTNDDQVVLLTCCSYETADLRIVIAGRRIREGEDPLVDIEAMAPATEILYPKRWYDKYGGKAPDTQRVQRLLERMSQDS